MKHFTLTFVVVLSLWLLGCTAGDDDFTATNILQRTIDVDESANLVLERGDILDIPAGTFGDETVLVFSNVFGGGDGQTDLFPTPTQEAEDLLGAVVINTPVDTVYSRDLTLTFDILDGNDRAVSAVQSNTDYRVYRFDFEIGRWQPGKTTARTNSAGTAAVATLPTDGFIGFIGSLALFDGLLAGTPVQTTIEGTVRNANGDGIATDVGLYVQVGAINVPVEIENGRVPNVNDEDNQLFTLANTVDSAANGSFTIEVPDGLVGQIVGVEFGREDPAYATQTSFDLLAPADTPQSDVEAFVVRFGENNIASQPLQSGSE